MYARACVCVWACVLRAFNFTLCTSICYNKICLMHPYGDFLTLRHCNIALVSPIFLYISTNFQRDRKDVISVLYHINISLKEIHYELYDDSSPSSHRHTQSTWEPLSTFWNEIRWAVKCSVFACVRFDYILLSVCDNGKTKKQKQRKRSLGKTYKF